MKVSATQRSEFEFFFILYAFLNISIKYHLNLIKGNSLNTR